MALARRDYFAVTVNYAKTVVCQFCYQLLKRPKLLPTCRHSVCTDCVMKVMMFDAMVAGKDLEDAMKSDDYRTIACPRCGVKNKIGEIGEMDENWLVDKIIDTLEPGRLIRDEDVKKAIRGGLKGEINVLAPPPSHYFTNWTGKKPITLFKAPSPVVKLIIATTSSLIPTIIAVCMDGSIFGMPTYNPERISWQGRVYLSNDWGIRPEFFGIFSACFDKATDSLLMVLMNPYGNKGVFWAKLSEIIDRGERVGTRLLQLISPSKIVDASGPPKMFFGITFNSDRRLLYACHGDSTDITIWSVDVVQKSAVFAIPSARWVGVIRGRDVNSLSKNLTIKNSFCATFSPPLAFEGNRLIQEHFLAVGNTWDSRIHLIISSESESVHDETFNLDSGVYKDRLSSLMRIAGSKMDQLNTSIESTDRPRDLLFDDFGNLYVADDESKTIKVFCIEKRFNKFWSVEKTWTSCKLQSQPLTMAVILDPKNKTPPQAVVGLFNNDLVYFQ